ncbi:MAG: M28 family peptidase, partial [Myxococcota bacterium]|nr:M28 family peptidase [Myxococcota bacterium]
LRSAGWDTQYIQLAGNVIACRGKGHYLFLAHTDTVAASPGAVDNGAAVATLLELARKTEAQDLCLGFPVGEELGFIGSSQFISYIDKWHPNADDLRLVLSLDLVGHGELSISGLSRSWDNPQLRWLQQFPNVHSEYGYQVVSRILPHMERSDHRPFADEGYLSALLLGRGPDGVFPLYHQKEDTQTDSASIQTLVETLESIATSTPPDVPNPSFSNATLYYSGMTFPSFLIWPILFAAIGVGLRDIPSFKESLFALGKGIVSLIPCSLILLSLTQTNLFSISLEEQTTASIFRLPTTGWWNAAPYASAAMLLGLLLLRWKLKPSGSAPLLCSFATILTLLLDPLLALPFGLATLLSTLSPWFAVFGGLYWLQPAILRELSFHGLLPSFLWPILFILILPVFGGTYARNRTSDPTE